MAVIEIGLKGNQHVRRIPPKDRVYAQLERKSPFIAKEAYKMVRMIVPEIIPSVECELCAISPARLKEIVGHEFYFASTVKKPYLSEAECHDLIDELKTIYMK